MYDRHLVFDHIVDRNAASLRERFEAVAASVRDLLTQSWLNTDANYTRQNPKRVYYLSMEFLIGRSLANNVMKLLLDPVIRQGVKEEGLDWIHLLDREPDAGLGNGGRGRLLACFLDSMATMAFPAVGYGLRSLVANGARDHLLAGACLAVDAYSGVGRGDQARGIAHPAQSRVRADDILNFLPCESES